MVNHEDLPSVHHVDERARLQAVLRQRLKWLTGTAIAALLLLPVPLHAQMAGIPNDFDTAEPAPRPRNAPPRAWTPASAAAPAMATGLRPGAQPQRPREAVPSGLVKPRPRLPHARTQSPVQGAVQGNIRGATRASRMDVPVYAATASNRGSEYTLPQPVLPAPRRSKAQAAFDPARGTIPPQEIPVRQRPQPEADPFETPGRRFGSFILRSTIDAGAGYTDNAGNVGSNIRSSGFSRLASESKIDSNWSVHSLSLRSRTERQDYFTGDLEQRTNVDLEAKGRIDVRRDTTLDLGGTYKRAPDTSLSTNAGTTATGRPQVDTFGGNAAVTQRFSRYTLRLGGQVEQSRFGDTPLLGMAPQSNRDRDVTAQTVTLRAGYAVSEAVQPFVETAANKRDYAIGTDTRGLKKGSSGYVLRAGIAVDLGPKIKGEAALGYGQQRPYEDSLAAYGAMTLDGNLAWSVSPLTTLKMSAKTGVLDTTVTGASGGYSYDGGLSIEHTLRRNLLLTAGLGLGLDRFEGISRSDRRLSGTLGLLWQMNRTFGLRVAYTHQSTTSTISGNDSRSNTIEGGLRITY